MEIINPRPVLSLQRGFIISKSFLNNLKKELQNFYNDKLNLSLKNMIRTRNKCHEKINGFYLLTKKTSAPSPRPAIRPDPIEGKSAQKKHGQASGINPQTLHQSNRQPHRITSYSISHSIKQGEK